MRPVTLGVLAPALSGFYHGEIIAGITRAAAAVGGRVVAIQTLRPGLQRREVVERSRFDLPVALDFIDGYLCLPAAVRLDHLADLRAAGKPVVLVDDGYGGLPVPTVAPDNEGGVRAAVEHLIGHGHRRIGFVGDLTRLDNVERYEAYGATLREHGIEPDRGLVVPAPDNGESGGRHAAMAMLASGLGSTAVVAATDENAAGVLDALTAAGLRVPQDQAIVGFDNSELVLRVEPALASVSQQLDGMGERATRLLLAWIAGEDIEPGVYRSPASFVARRSCGCTHLGLDGARGAADVADGTSGDRLARTLASALLGEPISTDQVAEVARHSDELVEVLDAGLRSGRELDEVRLRGAIAQLWNINRKRVDVPTMLRPIIAHIGESAVGHDERLVASLTLRTTVALAETQATAQRARIAALDAALTAQGEIDMDLLRSGENDPRNLLWISRSRTNTVACFGVWTRCTDADDDWPMGVVGVRDDTGPGFDRLRSKVGSAITVRAFPPAELIGRADPNAQEIVYITRVEGETSDWGLLAVVGPAPCDGSGSERVNHWAALLAVALDQESLLAFLHDQREHLAQSYQRERELVENVRASEERYALAATAANDGLWDWDVREGTIYYSERWKAMIGYTGDQIGDSPEEWFSRVHESDWPKLRDAIQAQLDGTLGTLEIQHRVRTIDSAYRWMLCRALTVRNQVGRITRIVGSLTDVTERTELVEQLRQRALYDTVTGLPNRSYFHDVLSSSIRRARRNPDHHFAVLFLDLDGFKVVNDSLGHATGDRLLIGVAQRLQACIRSTDTAARLGGDEFAVHLDEARADDVPRVVSHIQYALRAPFAIDGHEVVVSASIGVALSGTGYESSADVLRDADIAMYRAKARERGSHTVFDIDMRDGAVERMRIEVELRAALENGQLRLFYQPIVDLSTNRTVAMEALLRWEHPTRGLVSPGDFLPVAEETGLIIPIGQWVVEQACRDINEWKRRDGVDCVAQGLAVSVNVANRQFWHGALLTHIIETLAAAGLPPRCLAIEITEGVIMNNPELAIRTMRQLREQDFALHIDDFGTGYSSLGSLRRFPIQAMKIDRSFVAALGGRDGKDEELINTILVMGRNLGVDVIAEGVETTQQADMLRELGCQFVQGYYFSRPVPSDSIPSLVTGVLPVSDRATPPGSGATGPPAGHRAA